MTPLIEKPQLVRIKQIQKLTSLSRSHLYHLSSIGKFPRSVPLVPGGSARAWVFLEVQQWIDQRIAERDLEV